MHPARSRLLNSQDLGHGWTIQRAVALFVACNLLLYVDRGIIPGASVQFDEFISSSLGDVASPDLYLGLLQSGFVVGFSIAALISGRLIHYVRPFKIVGIGLSIWCLAALLSGFAQHSGSYMFLLFCRILSGVAEASFQTVVPPFLSDMGGKAAGTYLSLLYTCIPLGTAIGYPFGSILAESELRWSGCFFIESILMAPLALMVTYLRFEWRPERKRIPSGNELTAAQCDTGHDWEEHSAQTFPLNNVLDPAVKSQRITVKDELLRVLQRPVYVLTVLGYAASTGMMIGISTFGSSLLLEFGFFKQEDTAATVFGAALSAAGIIGTPIGGILLDRAQLKSEDAKLVHLTRQNLIFASLGMLCACLSCWLEARTAFLVTFTIGALFLFSATSGINLATMLAVHPANRSFAIALCTLAIHILGDVPSPVIIGALLDTLAPACARNLKDRASESRSQFVITPECAAEVPRTRLVLFIASLWLTVTVVTFTLAWVQAKAWQRRRRRVFHERWRERGSGQSHRPERESDTGSSLKREGLEQWRAPLLPCRPVDSIEKG